MKATVIISVYKNAAALDCVLFALSRQSERDFEIIVSQDGDTPEIQAITEAHNDINIKLLTRPDVGWTKNAALNAAIVEAQNDRLIFIDGDCVPHARFVEMHLRAASSAQIVTAGKRVKLSPALSQKLLNNHNNIKCIACRLLPRLFVHAGCRYVEEGFFVGSCATALFSRKVKALTGSNMSISKEMLLKINGFDEDYRSAAVGEDLDIQWRLQAIGCTIVSVRNRAVQYHLYHAPAWGDQTKNKERMHARQKENRIVCTNGIKKDER